MSAEGSQHKGLSDGRCDLMDELQTTSLDYTCQTKCDRPRCRVTRPSSDTRRSRNSGKFRYGPQTFPHPARTGFAAALIIRLFPRQISYL
jgi:hypothetical protein